MSDTPAQLRCDPGAAWDGFLKAFSPGTSELILCVPPTGGNPFGRRYTVGEGEEFKRNLPSHNDRLDTYFSINLPRVEMHKKPKKEDIGTIRAVFVDLDPDKSKPVAEEQERIKAETTDEALAAKGLPLPTVRIYSGGGCWLLWMLAEFVTVPEWSGPGAMPEIVRRVDGIGRRIASLFPHGDSCFNIDRIARLPGTVNWASLNPKKPGRVDALASVDFIDTGRRYRLEDFPEPLFESARAPSTAPAKVAEEPDADPDTSVELAELPTEELRRLAEHGRDTEDVGRHRKRDGSLDRSKVVHRFLCEGYRRGVSQSKLLGYLTGAAFGIAESIREKPDPIGEARKQYRKAVAAEVKKGGARGDHAGAEGFVCDENGIPLKESQHNIRAGLKLLGVGLAFDEFAERINLSGVEGFGPYLSDNALTRLRLTLDERFGFLPAKELFVDVVVSVALDNRCDPVREYLDGLKWDGTKRLDRWLSTYCGAAESPFVNAVGAIVLIAAVRRARKPGCKFDEMLVLESPQGQFKSTALKVLAVREDWFADELPLGSKTKELMEVLEGAWIVEAGELQGMRKGEVESIKSFLSRPVDKSRLAYGRITTRRPRRFIIIGTTNSDRYLKDATGNRRFWPVKVGVIDVEKLRAERDQLWAEAAQREAAGESIRLDPSLWGEAAEAQGHREEVNAFQSFLEPLLDGWTGSLRVEDVWVAVGRPDVAQRSQGDVAGLGAAMKRLGWEHKRLRFSVGGPPTYCYVRGTDLEQKRRLIIGKDRDAGDEWTVRPRESKPAPDPTLHDENGGGA